MGSMVWQLVCFLLELLSYWIAASERLLPLHLFAILARIFVLFRLFSLLEWPKKLQLLRFLFRRLGIYVYKTAKPIILSLLLLLLESPESLQHCLIGANRTLHRPLPSTSRLLLLSPELRQRIWTMLLEDFDCVHVREVAPRIYTSYVERLRLYMDINPEYSTMWFSTEPFPRSLQLQIAFIQSCRQIENEAGYDLFSNTTFYFTEAKALVSWIRSLTPAHKCDVRNMKIKMPNDFFNQSGITDSSLTRDAVQVRFAMEKLSGLRSLNIWFWTDHWIHTTKHEARRVYELVRNVKVSEVLIVQLVEETHVRSREANWMEVGWPADSQEEFAYAVWARIYDPGSELQLLVPVEQGSRAKFVLKVKEYEY